jgi:hypothetical protein
MGFYTTKKLGGILQYQKNTMEYYSTKKQYNAKPINIQL